MKIGEDVGGPFCINCFWALPLERLRVVGLAHPNVASHGKKVAGFWGWVGVGRTSIAKETGGGKSKTAREFWGLGMPSLLTGGQCKQGK